MTSQEIEDKLGSSIQACYHIVNTPGSAAGESIFLGTSKNGIPAWVNRAVAEADYRIGLGMITPHMDAGFSGGAKIVLPGVCSDATVDAFHVRGADYLENPLGNPNAPLRNDLEEFVTERVPLDFILNVITILSGEVYQCVAGHPIDAQRAGVSHARRVFGAPARQRYPIVVANCYPYEQDIWQSMKGLWCGDLLTAQGGTLIWLTDAREGSRGYPLLPKYIGANPADVKKALDDGNIDDPKSAATGYLVGQMKKRIHISLVSPGLTLADAEIMGISYYQTAEAAIEAAAARLSSSARQRAVGVLPQAGLVLPRLRK
jgi:nickel-dependent lactate racemase